MSVGPGYISPDHIASLETIIERDGLLNPDDPKPTNQRTNEDPPNPQATAEEIAAQETPGGEPIVDPPDGTPPLAADTEQSAQGDDEPPEITSLAALAQEAEAEESDILESIRVDNGLGYEVSLGEALNGYRDLSTNLMARQDAIELEHQTKLGEINGRLDVELRKLGALASVLASELKDDYANADLEEMRSHDPAGYADLVTRKTRREQMIKDAVERFDINSADREAMSQGDIDRMRQREATMLAQKMPHWAKDKALAQEVVAENTALMTGLGFSPQEIAGVNDHRQILVLHWAAQYRKSLKKAKGKNLESLRLKKGLKRPGLVNRATARVEQGDPHIVERKSRLGVFRKSGSVDDGAKLIETFLKGG